MEATASNSKALKRLIEDGSGFGHGEIKFR